MEDGRRGIWNRSPFWLLNISPPTVIADLLKVYDRWARVPFPSLRRQLEGPFEGRSAIDLAVCRAVGIEPSEVGLPGLYRQLLE